MHSRAVQRKAGKVRAHLTRGCKKGEGLHPEARAGGSGNVANRGGLRQNFHGVSGSASVHVLTEGAVAMTHLLHER